jgi:hypothetical protein
MRELKTRYDSRYSFNSIIIEGSFDASSRFSGSVQSLFQSINRNQIEPNMKMLLTYRETMICYLSVSISIILITFSDEILIKIFNHGKTFCTSHWDKSKPSHTLSLIIFRFLLFTSMYDILSRNHMFILVI